MRPSGRDPRACPCVCASGAVAASRVGRAPSLAPRCPAEHRLTARASPCSRPDGRRSAARRPGSASASCRPAPRPGTSRLIALGVVRRPRPRALLTGARGAVLGGRAVGAGGAARGHGSGLPGGGSGARHPCGDRTGARAADERLGARRQPGRARARSGSRGPEDPAAADLTDGAAAGAQRRAARDGSGELHAGVAALRASREP